MPSPLDINAASADDLVAHAGLPRERARALVAARPFRGWADVEKLGGFDREAVTALQRAGLVIGAPTDAEPGTG